MDNPVYRSAVNIAFLVAALLVVLWGLMQFSDEANWQLADFAIAWVLLTGTGLAYKLVTLKARGSNALHRIGVGLAVASALFLVWMNLAVGLIGNEGNPANLLYLGVLAVGIFMAIRSRFDSKGLALAMVAMACMQCLVVVLAWGAGIYQKAGSSVEEVALINGVFIALFLGSALLFRNAMLHGAQGVAE